MGAMGAMEATGDVVGPTTDGLQDGRWTHRVTVRASGRVIVGLFGGPE